MKKSALFLIPALTLSIQAANMANDPFFNDPFGDDIFKEMMQMQQQMDVMFEKMHQRMQQRASGMIAPVGSFKLAPQSQFEDKKNRYELITNIPQSNENQIDINTNNGMLSINAKIVKEEKIKDKNQISTFKSMQMYQEALPLPKDANPSKITTEYKNGKLVIYIEKDKNKISQPNTVNINGIPHKIKINNQDNNTSK